MQPANTMSVAFRMLYLVSLTLIFGVTVFVQSASLAHAQVAPLSSADLVELLVALDVIPQEHAERAQELAVEADDYGLDLQSFAYVLTDAGYIPEEHFGDMRRSFDGIVSTERKQSLWRDAAMMARRMRTYAHAFPVCGAPYAHFTVTLQLTAAENTLYVPTEIVSERMASVVRRNGGKLSSGDRYEIVEYSSTARQEDGFYVLNPGESEYLTIRARFQQSPYVTPGYYGLELVDMPFKYEPDHESQAYYFHYRFEPLEEAATEWVHVFDACEAAELRYLERMHELYPDQYPDPTPDEGAKG